MAFTFKELRQAKENIADGLGLSSGDAARVVGYFNGGGPAMRPDIVKSLISGDLSGVGPALVALGLSKDHAADLGKVPAAGQSITASGDPVDNAGGGDLLGGPDGSENAPQQKKSTQADKRTTKQKKTATSANMDCIELVKGDPVECVQGENVNAHELPPGLYDDITAIIDNYCRQQNIQEPSKMHPLQWQGVCYRVGESIKTRGILRDREREKTRGGTIYDGEKLVSLLALYGVICADYKQVAFTFNFQRFAGVSREYFHDYMGQNLTSSRLGIVEKAQELQRASLVGAVTGGGSATVGNIFLSKALAGLQETSTVVHVSASAAPAVSALPVFGPDGALLEEKRPE